MERIRVDLQVHFLVLFMESISVDFKVYFSGIFHGEYKSLLPGTILMFGM